MVGEDVEIMVRNKLNGEQIGVGCCTWGAVVVVGSSSVEGRVGRRRKEVRGDDTHAISDFGFVWPGSVRLTFPFVAHTC